MSAVWDRSAEFVSDHLGVILPVALLAFFVPASIEGNFPDVRETAGAALSLVLHLASLAFSVLSLWGVLVLVTMAGDPNAVDEAGAIARRRLLPALGVWVALFVALLVLLLPAPLALMASGYDMAALARGDEVSIGAALAGPIALYWLLLAAFLLWACARLALVTPLIVHERRMFDAIPRSFRLTRGATWPIIGVILLFAILAFVVRLAALSVFGSIFELVAGGDAGVSLAGVLTSVVVAGVQTGFMVIFPVFAAKLYLALRAARDRAAAL